MCLVVCDKRTKHYNRLRKHRKITVYKVVECYTGTYLVTPYFSITVNPGDYVSNRETVELTQNERASSSGESVVGRGIHVFGSLEAAKELCKGYNCRVILKCTAKMSDFVAAGSVTYNDMVFMKIFVPKKEYEKTLKNWRKR